MANQPATDPWLLNPDGSPDPFADNVDWHMPDLPNLDEDMPTDGDPVLDQHSGLQPEIVVVEGGVVREPVAPVVIPEPEPEGPETMELEDGTLLTLEKEKGQWKGTTSSSSGGNPQVYWGKTLKELIFNTLKAQANATKKIREQNAKLKFNTPVVKPEPVAQPNPSVRQLTADEVFEFKTQLESNPDLAFDTFFQKKTGLTIQQLVALAQRGADQGTYASNQLTAEAVNKTFLANNPDYYGDPNWTNFGLLVEWLAKFKLGESVPKGQETAVFDKLVSTGNYTAENLEEAFQDLSSDGLLVTAPKVSQPPPPVQVQQEPAPAPRPDSRIVSQVTRPRAALGIRPTDVTPVKPPEQRAPSAEDLEDLDDKQIASLMAGVRRQRMLNRRS